MSKIYVEILSIITVPFFSEINQTKKNFVFFRITKKKRKDNFVCVIISILFHCQKLVLSSNNTNDISLDHCRLFSLFFFTFFHY